MKSEWTKMKLSDIADFNPRETIKKGEIAKKISMDVLRPFYRDVPYYTEECFSGGTKFRNGDTIMARITPCLENGKTAQVSILNDGEVGFGSTEYIVFRAKEGIADKNYLYYLVCSPEVREPSIKSMVGSSGRQRVQTDVVKNLEIDVPPLVEQERIGSFLRLIDDKIALNDKINDNLEAQAQALFTLKAQDSCEMRSLGSFGTVITGKTPSTEVPEFYGNDVPFIKTPDMHGNVYITSSENALSTLGADSQANKYLPANTVIVACIGANAGEIAITSFCSQTNQQINAIISEYPCFLYFSIKAHTAELRTLGEGSSTMININKTSFENYEITTLKDDDLQLLERQLDKFFNLVLSNLQEIDKLIETKDILLTRLSH